MIDDAPQKLLRAISELLTSAEIPHMVFGSFASAFHGEPRATQDLDLVIDPTKAQLVRLLDAIDLDRFYVDRDVALDALQRRSMFNVMEMTTAWKADLVIRKLRAFSIEELRRRELITMFETPVATATAEDTIIAKLEWAQQGGSDRQLEDVAGILRVRGDDLDAAYIERWVSELGLAAEWQRARAQA